MEQSSKKLIGTPIYALLSSIIGMTSGSIAIAAAIKYLVMSCTYIPREFLDWGNLITISSVLLVGGLLVLVGSLLILRGKYNLGAILVLVPGTWYAAFGGMPQLLVLFTDYGHGWKGEAIAFVWLVGVALPITSGALAFSAKKEIRIVKGVISKKRNYWRASFALGLASGIPNLVIGPLLIGSWPLGALAPFLIIDGALMVYGSICVLQKKFARRALLILIPGLLLGFYGLPLLIGTLMSLLHLEYPWIFAPSTLGPLVGLAFPIASSIFAIYGRE